jgi:hypothetical protein
VRVLSILLLFAALGANAATIGFRTPADLFTGGPAEELTLEDGQMRWQATRTCVRALTPGELADCTYMTLRVRARKPAKVWLQLNERGGEPHYSILQVSAQWRSITLDLADFAVNPDRRQDGVLQIAEVDKILLLHVGGSRELWFADWVFERNAPSALRPDFYRPQRTGKLGIVAVPRDFRENDAAWQELLTFANAAGAQVLSLQAGLWAKDAAKQARGDFESWERFFRVVERHGFRFEMSKDMGGPFFLNKLDLPEGLRFKAFDDPALVARYIDYVTTFLERFGTRLHYLVIHAEGSEHYFRKHPRHLDPYCRFLAQVHAAIHRHSPHLRIGVNCDISTADDVLAKLVKPVDFIAYDVLKGKVVTQPADFAPLIERLLKLSAGKPIALQNAGWSTSQVDNASEAEQVAFIRQYFRVLSMHRADILYASFGAVYDHDMAITVPAYRALFPDLAKAGADRIADSMSHFGLLRSDGTRKPGWDAYHDAARAYYKDY